jgi:hypothetical protein
LVIFTQVDGINMHANKLNNNLFTSNLECCKSELTVSNFCTLKFMRCSGPMYESSMIIYTTHALSLRG